MKWSELKAEYQMFKAGRIYHWLDSVFIGWMVFGFFGQVALYKTERLEIKWALLTFPVWFLVLNSFPGEMK